jgi:hypothetical protein
MGKTKVAVTDYIEPDLTWETEQLSALPVEFSAHQLKHAPTEQRVSTIADAEVLVGTWRT